MTTCSPGLFQMRSIARAELLAEHKRPDGLIRNWTARIICKNGETKTFAFSNVSKAVEVPGWTEWGIATLVTDEIDRKASMLRRARGRSFRAS